MLLTDMDYNVMTLSAVNVMLCVCSVPLFSFPFCRILFVCYSHLITGYLVLLYAASYFCFPFGFCCCGLFAYVDSGIEGWRANFGWANVQICFANVYANTRKPIKGGGRWESVEGGEGEQVGAGAGTAAEAHTLISVALVDCCCLWKCVVSRCFFCFCYFYFIVYFFLCSSSLFLPLPSMFILCKFNAKMFILVRFA